MTALSLGLLRCSMLEVAGKTNFGYISDEE